MFIIFSELFQDVLLNLSVDFVGCGDIHCHFNFKKCVFIPILLTISNLVLKFLLRKERMMKTQHQI